MPLKDKIRLLPIDITTSDADAIVNDANTDLWLDAGVSGAIAKAGGPTIQKECQKLGPIDLGEVAVTGSGNLKSRHIFHAATLDFENPTSEASVYDAIKNSLLRAEELQIKSIVFPALGTGIGALDPQRCAEILLEELNIRLPQIPTLERVEIALLDPEVFEIFKTEYEKL